jgi:hypothetical protein
VLNPVEGSGVVTGAVAPAGVDVEEDVGFDVGAGANIEELENCDADGVLVGVVDELLEEVLIWAASASAKSGKTISASLREQQSVFS